VILAEANPSEGFIYLFVLKDDKRLLMEWLKNTI